MDNVLDFFREKKPWSKYKDLILDYYLEPYLHKVKTLGKPILVVDCFAGPGRFDDNQIGSPLIITGKLRKLYEAGFRVTGFFIEANKTLYEKLEKNTSNTSVPIQTRLGNFIDFVDEISNLARDHSVFVYLDPIKPSHLLFDDMRSVYDQLLEGQSVEALINFMSWGFLRGVWGSKSRIMTHGQLNTEHPQVLRFNQVAGGTYWQKIVFDDSLSQTTRADRLADGYASELHRWFKYVLTYPIREKYETMFPKYHLVFGSRSHHAVDLMNRAMVKARREFINAGFIKGFLFPNQPDKEVIRPEEIKKIVIETCQKLRKTSWTGLRIHATITNPSLYTDSEFNRAIKQAIKNGELASDCPSKKIQENALIWPLT
ncbi:MAG: three-Cys-motif partner protein TcmP [Sedimentisphaerales bacterium]